MLVSREHQFIFVKTRKTAGTSTQIALVRHMDHPDDIIAPAQRGTDEARELGAGMAKGVRIPRTRWRAKDWYWAARGLRREYQEHMPARFIKRYLGKETWDEYFSFAVDRNPWDQVISRYFYHFRPERGREKVPFYEFVLSDQLPAWSNWRIYADGDGILVDKLLRYDLLEEELGEVTDQLGLPELDLPRAKSHHRTDRRPYQEWYNPTTRERVAEVFHREIDYFGWTFE